MHSLRETIANFVRGIEKEVARIPGSRGPCQTPEIEELARFVMDYARIRQDARSRHEVAVEVGELAFRLRETQRTITEALFLLESQALAKRTKDKGRWKLQV